MNDLAIYLAFIVVLMAVAAVCIVVLYSLTHSM